MTDGVLSQVFALTQVRLCVLVPTPTLFLFSLPGYVGAATVGGAAWWFLYDQSGPGVTYYQLVCNSNSFKETVTAPYCSFAPVKV